MVCSSLLHVAYLCFKIIGVPAVTILLALAKDSTQCHSLPQICLVIQNPPSPRGQVSAFLELQTELLQRTFFFWTSSKANSPQMNLMYQQFVFLNAEYDNYKA